MNAASSHGWAPIIGPSLGREPAARQPLILQCTLCHCARWLFSPRSECVAEKLHRRANRPGRWLGPIHPAYVPRDYRGEAGTKTRTPVPRRIGLVPVSATRVISRKRQCVHRAKASKSKGRDGSNPPFSANESLSPGLFRVPCRNCPRERDAPLVRKSLSSWWPRRCRPGLDAGQSVQCKRPGDRFELSGTNRPISGSIIVGQ
jgi:hypothetical protein